VTEAAREAEKAANELAERLQAARQRKSEAAAEADKLNESLKHSSLVKGVVMPGAGSSGSKGGVAAAATTPSVSMGFMAAARSKVCFGGKVFWV
jgi:hypothetical protein